MTTQRIMQLLTVGIVLLAGITLAQYFQLKQQAVSAEDLKAEILAELRGGAGGPDPAQLELPHEGLGQGDTSERQSPVPVEHEPPAEPLSQNQYWISSDYSDDKPYGFSAWLELVPGGHFILEHCFAPDYSVAVSAEQDPYQSPMCRTMADTRIVNISDTEMVLKGDKSVPISLEVSAQIHTLSLKLDAHKIELTPGQKNTLWEGLSSLPSSQKAHEVAWKKHVELSGELEVPEE